MNLYVDTSALVKNYVQEAHSREVRGLLLDADFIATAIITRAEMEAALAKAIRMGNITAEEGEDARRAFLGDWPTWIRLLVDEELVAQAGELAWHYGLRGYDAVHLACALLWQTLVDSEVTLVTFDKDLAQAAQEAGLKVWPTVEKMP